MGWDKRWDGTGWGELGWDGMGWDGMGWDGMGWDGMGWDGMLHRTTQGQRDREMRELMNAPSTRYQNTSTKVPNDYLLYSTFKTLLLISYNIQLPT